MKAVYALGWAALAVALLGLGDCPIRPPEPPPSDAVDCGALPPLSGEVIAAENPVPNCYLVFPPAVEPLGALGEDWSTTVRSLAPAEATEVEPLPLIRAYRATMPPAAARTLAATEASTVYECEAMAVPEPPEAEDVGSWGLDRIDQRALPLDGDYAPLESGAEVHVYVVDTGRAIGGYQYAMGECYSAVGGSCNDDHDHGSHVAGTVADARYGVATEATIHAVRVLIRGSGSDADVIEGIQWSVDHAEANGWPALGNMSLGGGASDPLERAVCAAWDRGFAFAVAAGNDDRDACGSSPARVRQAVTACATEKDDDRAYFSNFGSCVDVCAPGVNILSTGKTGQLVSMSGTSMASPHAAGVMALCAERLGSSDPTLLRDCALSTATVGVIGDPGAGTPNRLLYAKED